MRFYYVALLAVATVLASTDAVTNDEETMVTKMMTNDVQEWERTLSTNDNDASTKRFLRKREFATDEEEGTMDEENEERGINEGVSNLAKTISTKAEPAAAAALSKTAKLDAMLKEAAAKRDSVFREWMLAHKDPDYILTHPDWVRKHFP
ncbi:unnamed protein product [Phytophthora lilii]|uniref:RxLR effector protein n=1 Tax=Phytophthora lilii TaxID=2077276 RepID=A0A9W6X012_9STRA|nr:unnamed protein product [Phytophthora lilii]